LCWDGASLTLIDLERSRPRAGALRQGAEIVLFLASLLAYRCGAARASAVAPVLRGVPRVRAAARFGVALLRPRAVIARLPRLHGRVGRELDGYPAPGNRWSNLRQPGPASTT
jgi:hypothetical protein